MVNMSLEAALDEERREILKLLEIPPRARGPASLSSTLPSDGSARAPSPLGTRSPVRSMLDIDSAPPPPRHVSMAAAAATGVIPGTPPSRLTQPSMTFSADAPNVKTSPVDGASDSAPVYPTITTSDPMPQPPPPLPSSTRGSHRPHDQERGPTTAPVAVAASSPLLSPEVDYQFGMQARGQGITVPNKRGPLGRGKSSMLPQSVARVRQALDRGGPSSRRGSERGPSLEPGGRMSGRGSSSQSPSASLGRAGSPHTAKLNTNSFNLMLGPNQLISDRGEVVDMTHAYRRLSDAHLARSGGSLSNLPSRVGPDPDGQSSPAGEVRLHADDGEDEQAEEAVVAEESSQDESADDSDSDRHDPSVSASIDDGRGRVRNRTANVHSPSNHAVPRTQGGEVHAWAGHGETSTLAMGAAKGPRKALSLLAAAEEERQQVSSQARVKSLLDPPITVTGPMGDRRNPRKPGVHPTTSFDQSMSTPVTSDTEAEMSDIRRAQRMSVSLSAIASTAESHRSIRTVLRGEFTEMQREAEEGHRRIRTYLVATDLSDEAAYALEWTIGTILRDGDTLLAVYALDEGGGGNKDSGPGAGGEVDALAIGEGALAMKDQAAIIGSQTSRAQVTPTGHSNGPGLLSPLAAVSPTTAATVNVSPESRHQSRAEQERSRATEDITQRCVKLLRKTRLQVRVVVEVIHCKSPKHLITEVIDVMNPTLVILGSRGRSALKGVLLGSFSNYLVTKSSVPVMVARKRLRKHQKPSKRRSSLSTAANLASTYRMPGGGGGGSSGNNGGSGGTTGLGLDVDDDSMINDVRQVNNLTPFSSLIPGFNKGFATAKVD